MIIQPRIAQLLLNMNVALAWQWGNGEWSAFFENTEQLLVELYKEYNPIINKMAMFWLLRRPDKSLGKNDLFNE